MAVSKVVEISASAVASRRMALIAASAFLLASVQAQAQQAQIAQDGRVIVTGEGDIAVAPDHAQITGGVTTRAKSVKEATDANSKAMAAVTAALLEAGIEQKDIQTLRFSIQPVYAPQGPNTEPKLSGYSVSNQVRVKIRQIGKIGEILDRLIAVGATDLGNIAFLVSNPSQALDQARAVAIADARRKAEVYAHASGGSDVHPRGSRGPFARPTRSSSVVLGFGSSGGRVHRHDRLGNLGCCYFLPLEQ